MTDPHLAALPEETLANIASRLDVDSLCSIRMTCRAICDRTTHVFVKNHFQSRGFLFTTKCLNTLVQIASSKKLRRGLKHVYFVTALFSRHALKFNQAGSHMRRPDTPHREAWIHLCNDQSQLVADSQAVNMLAKVFRQLPGLRSVGIVDTLSAFPPHADCYGLHSAERLTRMLPTCAPFAQWDREFFTLLHCMWRSIIAALAASQRTTLIKIFTFLHPVSNLPLTVGVHMDPTIRFGLLASFSNVTHLQLQLRGCLDEGSNGDLKSNCRAIESFARLFVAATNLALAFDHSEYTAVLLYWFFRGFNVSKLKIFALRSAWIDSMILTRVLFAAKCLVEVQIMNVYVIKGNWIPVLCALQRLQKLGHVHLMNLGQEWHRVAFLRTPDPDSDGTDDGDNGGQPLPITLPMIGTSAPLTWDDDEMMSISAYSSITAALNDANGSDDEAGPQDEGDEGPMGEEETAASAANDDAPGVTQIGLDFDGDAPAAAEGVAMNEVKQSGEAVNSNKASTDDAGNGDGNNTGHSNSDGAGNSNNGDADNSDGNDAGNNNIINAGNSNDEDTGNNDTGNPANASGNGGSAPNENSIGTQTDDGSGDGGNGANNNSPVRHMHVQGGEAVPIKLDPRDHSTLNHRSPADVMAGVEVHGTWICVYGEQIARHLPTFIEQYNVMDQHVTLASGAVLPTSDEIPSSDTMLDIE